MPELIPADRLAGLEPAELAVALRPLFEDAEWLAGRLASRRFSSWAHVVDASSALLSEATDAEKAEVLRSHPRLGAAPAELRRRSEASWREQGGDGDHGTTVFVNLAAANDRYDARFGFPFVDWVAGRPLAEMIQVIDSRLGADPAAELSRGCRAIVDIARDRLAKIVGDRPNDTEGED